MTSRKSTAIQIDRDDLSWLNNEFPNEHPQSAKLQKLIEAYNLAYHPGRIHMVE